MQRLKLTRNQMREFDLTRKPALRLLRDSGNDINRALKSRNHTTSISEVHFNAIPTPNAADWHREQYPVSDPADTPAPEASKNGAPPKSSARHHDNELAEFFKALSIIAPAFVALDRKLAASAPGPQPRARKKISFYAYSVAYLPRSLSVLLPRPYKPPRVPKGKEPASPPVPMRYQELAELSKKYPYHIVQEYLTHNPPTSAHVMGCSSRDDAYSCLAGYRERFEDRLVFMKGRGRARCVVMNLLNQDEEWGFMVRVLDTMVCRVTVIGKAQGEDI